MQFVRNVLNEQRRRLTGSLMQYLEQNVYPHLDDRQRKELRARVIGAIGQYHDTCLDMLKASVADGTLINEDAVRVLAQLNSNVNALRQEITSGSG